MPTIHLFGRIGLHGADGRDLDLILRQPKRLATVAVADYDGRLRLLDVVSGWSMAPIAAFGDRIDALAWAP